LETRRNKVRFTGSEPDTIPDAPTPEENSTPSDALPNQPALAITISTGDGRTGKTVQFIGVHADTSQPYTFLTANSTVSVSIASSPARGEDSAPLLLVRSNAAPDMERISINNDDGQLAPNRFSLLNLREDYVQLEKDAPARDPAPGEILSVREIAPAAAHTPAQLLADELDDGFVIIADNSNGEDIPLLPGRERQVACTWSSGTIAAYTYRYTVKPVINMALYFREHPYVSIGALLTAATPAVTALANPAHISADKLGADWWKSMSFKVRLHSVTNCFSSLTVNTLINAYFLPTFWTEFTKNIKHTFDGPGEFFDNSLAAFLALGGATAQMAIAYNAWLWLPFGLATAAIPATISFSVTLASRYLGVKNILRQIHHMFHDDAKAQAEFSDALEHVDEKYLNDLQAKYADITGSLPSRRIEARRRIAAEIQAKADARGGKAEDTPLNDKEKHELTEKLKPFAANAPLSQDEYEYIEKEIAKAMSALLSDHPDLIKDKTAMEYLTKYSLVFFKLSFAFFLVGAPYFLTFMQKGFDGVNTLSKFAGKDLVGLNEWIRRTIGVVPGLASGGMAFNSAYRIADTAWRHAVHLYHHPSDIPGTGAIGLMNFFAASGPANVAAGVAANKDNVIGIHTNDDLDSTFVMLNGLAGGTVNTNASINTLYPPEKPKPQTVTLDEVKKHVANVDAHLVHRNTADKFRNFLGDLKKLKQPQADSDDDDEVLMKRNQSGFFGTT
jgi:hypothetical protein